MKKTIYIAGKISGLPYWRTYFKFMLRYIWLSINDFKPINPMWKIKKDISYYSQVKKGIMLASGADCIYLSHNWRNSKGAFRELRAYLGTGKKEVVSFLPRKCHRKI